MIEDIDNVSGDNKMAITKKTFGKTKDGEQVYAYTLDNQKGICAEILNYGGIVRSLRVTGSDGNTTDVILGYETMEEYYINEGYLGAIIGRNSNRIENACFELNGKTYNLNKNDGIHNLHGGLNAFNSRVWDVIENDDADEPSIVLSITSPDGEEGFPGTIDVTVTYTITSNNALMINYKAKSDTDTICNLTNHSYFNLSGHNSGNIYNQTLKLNSSFYTPNIEDCMPNGEVLSVKGTPMDFTSPKPIGKDINADFEQIKLFGGYDHNFAINGRGYRLCAEASSPDTGITMEVYTDQPAVQLYTANGIEDGEYHGPYKDGAYYKIHCAFCLETQCFPNAMKYSHYPSPILKKNEVYDHTTEYRFIIK